MSTKQTKNFVDQCLAGEALLEDIDNYVDDWHESNTEIELHEFLGMTEKEYSLWVVDPNILPFIITAHKEQTSIENVKD